MLYFQHLLIEQTQSKAIFGSKVGILKKKLYFRYASIIFLRMNVLFHGSVVWKP